MFQYLLLFVYFFITTQQHHNPSHFKYALCLNIVVNKCLMSGGSSCRMIAQYTMLIVNYTSVLRYFMTVNGHWWL